MMMQMAISLLRTSSQTVLYRAKIYSCRYANQKIPPGTTAFKAPYQDMAVVAVLESIFGIL